MSLEGLDARALAADAAWWALYDASFPAAEREPRDVILRSIDGGVALAHRAIVDGGTVGLASSHLLVSSLAVFLVYLAVAPDARGAGLGGALLERALADGTAALAARGLDARGLVWEVDDPARAGDAVEKARRDARVRFFERRGGRLLARPYRQPPLGRADDGGAPVPMRLMWRGEPLDDDAEAALARSLYVDKYATANGIDRGTLARLLDG